jgi:hypothetical protein
VIEADFGMPRSGGDRNRWAQVIAVSLLLAGCTGNTTHEVCAIVLAAEGSVTADDQRIVAPHRTNGGSPLCPGTIIRTSANSSAKIACLSNTLIHLFENSTVEIDRLTLRKDGNETDDEMEARSAHCRLAMGTMTIAYQGAEGVSEFIAVTPHGTVTAKFSSVIRLEVDNQVTRITCASGMVSFEPSNGHPPVLVEAGFVAESTASETTMVPATTTAKAQQAISNALDVERQLAALAISRRETLPKR